MTSVLPNFLIGGASAAGTSFLFHLLEQHDDIYLPRDMCSEPHFFAISQRYTKGIEYYQKIWFSEYQQQRAIGERSSAYFYFPDTAPRLKKHLPHIKLIFILRDPVERAFAQYRYRVFRGTEDLDFKTAIDTEAQRLQEEIQQGIEKRSHDYTGRSLYGLQLKRFLAHFSLEQILILSSEKLKTETAHQLRRITDFLEIRPLPTFHIISEFSTPSVKDPTIQYRARQHFGNVRHPDTLKTAKWEALLHAIRARQTDLHAFIETEQDAHHLDQMRQNMCSSQAPIPSDMKVFLQNYFAYDQELFFDLAHRHIDFSPWFSKLQS